MGPNFSLWDPALRAPGSGLRAPGSGLRVMHSRRGAADPRMLIGTGWRSGQRTPRMPVRTGRAISSISRPMEMVIAPRVPK